LIKRERVKKLLTNRLKILKDRIISKRYPSPQNTMGLWVRVIARWAVPRKFIAWGSLRRASPEKTMRAAAFTKGLYEKGNYA
jgi:hypothetical protein